MKDLNMFNRRNFEKFMFGKDYLQICNNLYKSEPIILLNHNRFIAPASYHKATKFNFIESNKLISGSFNFTHKESINGQQLFYAEINFTHPTVVDIFSNRLEIEFKMQILLAELRWIEKFFGWIYEHLNKHEPDLLLSKNSVVCNNFATIVQYLQLAQQALNNLKSPNIKYDSYLSIAVNEILKASQLLAKLVGERSYLYGSLISMLSLFQAIYNVYFFVNEEIL